MSKKAVKLVKLLLSIGTPLVALACSLLDILLPDLMTIDISLALALTLLAGLSGSISLSEYDDEQKWTDIETNLTTQWKATSDTMLNKIDLVSNCQIQSFDNTTDWVRAIDALIKTGHHSVVHASLDAATRSKARPQHNAIWNHILSLCKNPEITYRHVIRIRPNNFENLLDRITAGNATNESYFAYYELPQEFPFATFEVIDEKYIATRSPFVQGESPHYMIIENAELGAYFVSYFRQLWQGAVKIDNLSIISNFYNKFSSNYTDEEVRARIEEKIETLKKAGIMDDI